MNRRLAIKTAGAAIAIAVAALYFIFNPATSQWAPKCAFHAITGYDCPGCGSQRMLHALLHGDIAGAWRANAFMLCSTPVLGLMLWAASSRRRFPRLYAALNSPAAILTATAALVAWTVARNLT